MANNNNKNVAIHPKQVPFLVYADKDGNIFEDESLEAAGKSGSMVHKLSPKDFIELPYGSEFFLLPDRKPIGFDMMTGSFRESTEGTAVSVFVSPAHTQLYSPAYNTMPEAPVLPLFSYTPVGWFNGKFYTTAVRIDPDKRQDCELFDQEKVIAKATKALEANKHNRLLEHISHCALTYLCPAARNYFLGRWEAPLPTSPACNSQCLGCISYQPKDTTITSPQNRITFVPTPEEIAEIAIPHLEKAPNPIVSFGQGCEGEPLLVWETILEAIKLIRLRTSKGIINLNTNGSNPDAVDKLCKAGLDSIRISMNSVQEPIYNAYYRPNNYTFQNVMDSFDAARRNRIWISINYFTFPGLTDTVAEFEALKKVLGDYKVNMIQWRNFNIDQDWYLNHLGMKETPYAMGIKKLMKEILKVYPDIYYGYFNPGKEIIMPRMSNNRN